MTPRWHLVLVAVALVAVGALGTSAFFRDSSSLPPSQLAVGEMHIDLATNSAVKPETVDFSSLAVRNLTAGGSVARTLKVANNSQGNVRFGYRVQLTATTISGNLTAALRLTVRRGGTVSGSTCTGGTVVGTAGSSFASGFDQPAGADLTPGQSHDLCIQISRASGTSVSEGSRSTLTFSFPARQVAP